MKNKEVVLSFWSSLHNW